MSEYQYYEFLAMDRPLTSKEMESMRALSTRADITPVSFTNHYNFGDFKGDPEKLMAHFFDAHVYFANWGAAVFMLRVPIETLSEETADAMADRYFLDFTATKTHWIITWSLGEEPDDYDRFVTENGRGWMARLTPVRDELLRGDLRSLYIGWLAAVTKEDIDDDEFEPLSISGLGNLTPAQKALAEFLEVDPDLLAGAGMGSPAGPEESVSEKEIEDWVDELPRDEVKDLLKQLLDGKSQQAERALKSRFAKWLRGLHGDHGDISRRTVGEILKNAGAAEKIRMEREKREEKERAINRRKAREAYLKTLATDFTKAWKAIQETVERGSGLAYDEACSALVDLSEAYAAHESRKMFRQELEQFMAGHMRRKALIRRLENAGIW